MKRPHRYVLWVATAGAAAVGSLVYGWSGLRLAAALVLCVLLPGWGWARRLRPADRGDTLALAVVLSLCATVAVSTAMVLAHRWSWTLGATCLAGIAVLGFVPARRLLGGLGLRLRWRLFARDVSFTDWYAAYAERRRLRAEAEEAAAIEWTDWYAERRRLADEAAAREWTGWLVAKPDQAAAQPEEEWTTVRPFTPSAGTDTAEESR
jgi:hypothetical protein